MSEATANAKLFLTKIVISYQLSSELRIRDSYDWHQRVWQCFPGRDERKRDFLTRLDDKDGEYQLLLVSSSCPTRPEWCPAEVWAIKEISPAYFDQPRYAFQLRANPTKKAVDPAKPKVVRADGKIDRNKNSRRLPLAAPNELRTWLARKAEANGFAIERATIRPFGNQYFKKVGAFAPHFAVDFEGVLTITDGEKFKMIFYGRPDENDPHRLVYGLGSAKAFGFGMLVIAPVS